MPERLLADPAALRGEAERWLESYRKHYLAWHERVHAPRATKHSARVRRSPVFEAALRLARLGRVKPKRVPFPKKCRPHSTPAASPATRCPRGARYVRNAAARWAKSARCPEAAALSRAWNRCWRNNSPRCGCSTNYPRADWRVALIPPSPAR